MSTSIATYEQVAAAADFGTPTARKTGRDPRWPYVPVLIIHPSDGSKNTQHQILGLAYATRAEAIEAAEKHIAASRALLAAHLACPRMRALREQYGLPREIER